MRAYAAILVVLYHSSAYIFTNALHNNTQHLVTHNPLKAIILEGHFGVSLFMVLSGFIFTVGLLGKDISYKGFMTNRLIRIYPLYIFVIIAAVSAFPLTASFNNIALSILPFGNLPQALHTQISGTGLDPFAMSWTIALELQFYLIFPFILSMLNRRRLKQVLCFCGAIVLVRLLLTLLPGADNYFISFYTIFGRFDQFFAGILAGIIFIKYRSYVNRYAVPTLIASLMLLMFASLKVNNTGGIDKILGGWSVLMPIVYAILSFGIVLSYVSLTESIKKQGRTTNFIAKIGELSYSIYLIHVLVIIALVAKFPSILTVFGDSWIAAFFASTLIILPIVLLTSLITYNGIEKPFLDMRRKYTK